MSIIDQITGLIEQKKIGDKIKFVSQKPKVSFPKFGLKFIYQHKKFTEKAK